MSGQIVTPDTAALTVSSKDVKINLLGLNHQQMREFFKNMSEEPFRADQVTRWMYHYCCGDFDEMTDIDEVLYDKLREVTEIRTSEVVEEQRLTDDTIKWAIAVGDQRVETVYILGEDRAILCVSPQVGCALGCKFCPIAQQGFNHNLRVSEVIGQIWRAVKIIGAVKTTGVRPITNVVMMGMGESLLNPNNVVPVMGIMLDDFDFDLSKRRITLSTSGVMSALGEFGDMIDIALTISLHTPNNTVRDEVVPVNRGYNIETFLNLVYGYISKSNTNQDRVTIKYVMLDHVNDGIEHAHELAALLRSIPYKINLIPWNPLLGASYGRSSNSRIDRFSKVLTRYGFTTIMRKTCGDDIDATCDQLVGDAISHTKCTLRKWIQGEAIDIEAVQRVMTRIAQMVRVTFMTNNQAEYTDSANNYGVFSPTLRQYVAAQ